MKPHSGKIAIAFIALGLLPVASAEAGEVGRRRIGFVTASRGGYVFRGSDAEKVSNFGLVFGKGFGSAGISRSWFGYGIEGDWRMGFGSTAAYFSVAARAVPAGLRLTPASAEQRGGDGWISVGGGFLPEVGDGARAGFELGLRARRWALESGPLPSVGQAGFAVAALYEGTTWSALFEAGLMAMGVGVPAELGMQRDASTLRARLGYRLMEVPLPITPWVEFFHTHRNFYGATIIPGETALFIDEASLQLGITVELGGGS